MMHARHTPRLLRALLAQRAKQHLPDTAAPAAAVLTSGSGGFAVQQAAEHAQQPILAALAPPDGADGRRDHRRTRLRAAAAAVGGLAQPPVGWASCMHQQQRGLFSSIMQPEGQVYKERRLIGCGTGSVHLRCRRGTQSLLPVSTASASQSCTPCPAQAWPCRHACVMRAYSCIPCRLTAPTTHRTLQVLARAAV